MNAGTYTKRLASLLFLVVVVAPRIAKAQTNHYYYDKTDRLVGVEYGNGLSIGYAYDRNGNLTNQVHFANIPDTNNLPVLWRFLNGLSAANSTSTNAMFADADGDGWSNYQEWKAGSRPTSISSVPVAPEQKADAIARLELPFVPTNWVVLAAQLDGLGTEELIVGADGNTNGVTNRLFILNETHAGWAMKGIPIGAYGITSLAFGTVNHRNEPAIYAGLRSTDGKGGIVEIRDGQIPVQTLLLIQSTNESVFVLGINSGKRLVVSLADASSDMTLQELNLNPDGSVTQTVIATNWQGTGFGTVGTVYSRTMREAYAQFDSRGQIELFAGPLEVTSNRELLPRNAARDPSGQWHFELEEDLTWEKAREELARYGSALVRIKTQEKNSWLLANYRRTNGEDWIGFREGRWLDDNTRVEDGFNLLCDQYSGDSICGYMWMHKQGDCEEGEWAYTDGLTTKKWALAQVISTHTIYSNRWTVPLTGIAGSGGNSAVRPILQAFRADQTNSASLIYAFVSEQKGGEGLSSSNSFSLVEWSISDNNVTPNTVFTTNQPPGGFAVGFAQAVLNMNKSLFTAEPDGRIFMWTATNATAPLERQLFDAQHFGHSWKGLTGVKAAAAGDSLAALRAVSTNEAAVDVFLWSPQPVLETPVLQSWPQTAPAANVLPSASSLGNLASVTVRLWDAEGNSVTNYLEYQLSSSTSWQKAKVEGLVQPLSTSPSGMNHILLWNAQEDLGVGVTTHILLRARAEDVTLLGEWSAGTPFQVITTSQSDTDSLPDWWELQFFRSIHDLSDSSDFDRDGVSDFEEYVADTDPTNSGSSLRITSIQLVQDGIRVNVRIEWQGGTNATQTLQRLRDLETGDWQDIITPLPPPHGSFQQLH